MAIDTSVELTAYPDIRDILADNALKVASDGSPVVGEGAMTNEQRLYSRNSPVYDHWNFIHDFMRGFGYTKTDHDGVHKCVWLNDMNRLLDDQRRTELNSMSQADCDKAYELLEPLLDAEAEKLVEHYKDHPIKFERISILRIKRDRDE